ncbi:AbiH family protein [Listeria booriae]|uniref:AbiH family protein n=1 Tax=Listeria booriae TaxID=1552123 RepID=UPI001E350FC7|nr:AbiH family protein [Listeria booriae]MCD2208553.1 bacteriophage abortive infection AbiH family protein [Listeria booriae]
MRQLLIIGNGFDIQSELPSRFIDFYKDRVQNQFELAFEVDTYDLNRDSLEKLQLSIPTVFISNEHQVSSFEATPIKWSEKCKKITFWDLVMMFSFEKENNINWCNIEEHINLLTSKLLKKDENEESVLTVESLLKVNETRGNSDIHGNVKRVLELVIDQTHDENLIFISVINKLREDKYTNSNIDEFLLEELYLYEESFKNYIQNEADKHSTVYGANKSELLDKISIEAPEYTYLLNFNYTFNKFPISEKVRPGYLTSTNIHGSIGDEVIFGIDHSSVLAESRVYPFTKTFRKLIKTSSPNPEKSVLKKDIKYIIFYGHSLGSADYSYFQSIFDYLDIYENQIILTFYFSNYLGSQEGALELKREQSTAVQKMLHIYGESMDNKVKGKNLIHKLLIEERLSISEI